MDSNAINQWLGNIVSVAAVIGALAGWVAPIAAVVALIWYLIQIYESETVRRWAATRRARKLARLKARVLMLEAQSRRALPGPDDTLR